MHVHSFINVISCFHYKYLLFRLILSITYTHTCHISIILGHFCVFYVVSVVHLSQVNFCQVNKTFEWNEQWRRRQKKSFEIMMVKHLFTFFIYFFFRVHVHASTITPTCSPITTEKEKYIVRHIQHDYFLISS